MSLPRTGWKATILSGSITDADTFGDAARFYRGLDVRPVDMTRALHAADPMAADPPLHPSYEDRANAPDRIFASLDDHEAEHQVTAWAKALQSAGAAHADVLHLHHLTPLYEAALRVAPQVPVVGHLHGTELLMLEAIEHDPYRWPHGEAWAERLRAWAEQAQRLIVLTETACDRAARAARRRARTSASRSRTVSTPTASACTPSTASRSSAGSASRSTRTRRSCSTSAASPRSSASRC